MKDSYKQEILGEYIKRASDRVEEEKDGCTVCKGDRGGVKGNENMIEGVVMCDYCHYDHMSKLEQART